MESFSDDREYFITEIMPYYEYIRRFVFTISDNDFLSLDITQEAMLLAWKGIGKLKKYRNLKSALTTIAKNALMDYYRKHGNDIRCIELRDTMMESMVEEDAVTLLLSMEKKSELMSKLNTLNENQLKVVVLYYYFEMPLKEIGQVLKINYNTVLSLHRRALIALRKKMDDPSKNKNDSTHEH